MASQAQILANQSNAQRSTGPVSVEGKSAARRNAVRHGLATRESDLFFHDSSEQAAFIAHKAALTRQLVPIGEIEEKLLHLYAFSLFQAERSQSLELACEQHWLPDQTNPILLANMDRMARYGEVHERRAARSLNELRKLQLDRFASDEVAQYIAAAEEVLAIPAALPVARIRKTNLYQTNPMFIGETLINPSHRCYPKAVGPDSKGTSKYQS